MQIAERKAAEVEGKEMCRTGRRSGYHNPLTFLDSERHIFEYAEAMLKLTILLVAVFILFSLAQRQSLRSAGLIDSKNALLVALDDFNTNGRITNYPTSSIRVWLSTNVVHIGGTRYVCLAMADRGWGFDGGMLAMTTNKVFIWLDPVRSPKVLTNGYRPKFFSTRF